MKRDPNARLTKISPIGPSTCAPVWNTTPRKLKVLELGYMVAAMSLPPALRRGDLSKVADGITELSDSENS